MIINILTFQNICVSSCNCRCLIMLLLISSNGICPNISLMAVPTNQIAVTKIVMKNYEKAKSRKYQGVFEVKSRVKTWQVRGIGLNNWSISKSQNGERSQVSGRVSAPCWHATPVANAQWKPLNSVKVNFGRSLNRCRVGETGLNNQSTCKPPQRGRNQVSGER